MTVVMVVSTSSDELQLGQILTDDSETIVSVTQIVPNGERTVPYFWVIAGVDSFEETVRDDHRVATLQELHSVANRRLYRLEWTADRTELFALAVRNDIRFVAAVGTADEWRVRFEASGYGPCGRFRRACDRAGIPLSIERVVTVDRRPARPYGLTDKQLELLVLAFDEGYFEVPRRATLTELAEAEDISDSAAAQRLRRGLSRLVRHTVIHSGREPFPNRWDG